MRTYRFSVIEENEIADQIQSLLAAGLMKESSNFFSFPFTLVMKRDEDKMTRLCVDYRKLNSIMKNYAEPLPHIDDILDKLSFA